jgi:nitrogen regulatory protein PII
MNTLTRTDKIAYLFLILVFGLGIYFVNTDLQYFNEVYTKEDGFAEYGTAFLLFCSGFLMIYRFFKLQKVKKNLWKIGVLGIAMAFLFGSGEEISWGQRIFDVESSAFFIENNAQGETNLHNIVVDGKKINKIIFSQLLTVVLIIYLIIAPLLFRKFESVKKLANTFAVPIVRWHHTIAFLMVTGTLAFMGSDRKWELYELAFGVIFFLIFINPLNKDIYEIDS